MSRLEVGKFMGPVSNHDLFFCGFHIAKKNPKFQVKTMHYCGMRGEGDHEMHQCLLYDSVSPGAKLIGDGQTDEQMVARRDEQFGVSTARVRAERVEAIGDEVPEVPPPRSVATIGRQWTARGEDRPTRAPA